MFHVPTINLYLIIIKKNKNVKGKNGIFCSNITFFCKIYYWRLDFCKKYL